MIAIVLHPSSFMLSHGMNFFRYIASAVVTIILFSYVGKVVRYCYPSCAQISWLMIPLVLL